MMKEVRNQNHRRSQQVQPPPRSYITLPLLSVKGIKRFRCGMPERAGRVRFNAGDAKWVQRRSAFVHFELRGLSPGSSTKAAEFLGSETLRLPLPEI